MLESTRELRRRIADAGPWARSWRREPAALRRIPRPRTIRAKVVCLLAVPIISLMTLWGLVAVQAALTVYSLTELKQLNASVQAPTDTLVSALQRERIGVARFLGAPGAGSPDTTLTAAYTATDTAAAALRTGAGISAAAATGLGADASGRISTLLGDLAALPALRGEAANRQVTWATAQTGYTKAIEDALALQDALASVLDRAGQNSGSASAGWPVIELARSREMLARQAAIVANAQAAGSGLTADGYRQFAGAYYSEYELEQAALPQLRAVDASAYRQATSSAAFQRLQSAQQTLLDPANPGDPTVPGTDTMSAEASLTSLAPTALDDVGRVVADAGTAAVAQIDPYGHALVTKAGFGVVLGLIAVAACLLVSVWIGRGLVLELIGLRDSALDLARRRLPRAIARLRAGEKVSLEAEVRAAAVLGAAGNPAMADGRDRDRADGSFAGQDEIGQVASALATVHQAALRAALDRAEAVSGVSGVFLNLARRSQVLLHRQLALLDQMERRIDAAQDLEDLFRLDHLATRMRRHAEGLIILSGAAPGRGWRRPAPLMDVVRGAVAEVEDFARIDVLRMPDAHVAGAAIADLTHLLAELVENATVFSPPHTRVQVHGSLVAAGYALEIEDRGLGMSPEAMNEANRRLDSARQDDLFDSDRLGLFVVSRLARRHGIRVALRHSAYGGMAAVVLLPTEVLETAAVQAAALQAAAKETAELEAALEESASAPLKREAVLVSAGTTAQAPAATAAAATATPTVSAAPAEPSGSMDAEQSENPDAPGGLPRRVRQANLAPGLRGEPEPPASAENEDGPNGRSPEQARSTMSAYQKGWSLGRAAADSPDG
jgi:signal transduction histidine kinase